MMLAPHKLASRSPGPKQSVLFAPPPHLLAAPAAHGARLAQRTGAQRHHTGAQGANTLSLCGTPARRHQAQHGAARLVVGAPVVDLCGEAGGGWEVGREGGWLEAWLDLRRCPGCAANGPACMQAGPQPPWLLQSPALCSFGLLPAPAPPHLDAVAEPQLHHAAVARLRGAAAAGELGAIQSHKARPPLRHQRLHHLIRQQGVGHLGSGRKGRGVGWMSCDASSAGAEVQRLAS